MRIESYTRDIRGDGYLVVGSGKNWNSHDSSSCRPIKMSLTCWPDSNEPVCDNLEELICLADSDMFTPPDNQEEFSRNYANIVRRNCPDWQLGAFRVFVGGIALYYGNTRNHEAGFLWIIGANNLRLTFEAPRTRLGFAPIYKVDIRHKDGRCFQTCVDEDLGYIRREIYFHLRDPHKADDDIYHRDNQYIEVTEYAGV
ncbi:MAG: hypothetical protein HFE52_07305 [Clostridia bacterium]|jgi:hypothetical protein|nr:hypothetical protein [Clostridia bacterium]